MRSGLRVRAIDASPEMVRIASRRGVHASLLKIEELERMHGTFDGAISDFGAINCVDHLDSVRQSLARLIRPGGTLALCVLGRFCAWETAWFLLRLEPSKAMRRWRGHAKSASLGINVRFYSMSELRQALEPDFTLCDWQSIGLWVPPSYVRGLPAALLQALGKLDRITARRPILRAMGDHRLALFIRR
jgi:SAM-dependent methyltransferase